MNKLGDEEPYLGDKSYFPNRYPHATYAAMISYFDENVGKLVQQLKELGVYKNTLIIVTSDNGATYNGGTDSPYFNSEAHLKVNMDGEKALQMKVEFVRQCLQHGLEK